MDNHGSGYRHILRMYNQYSTSKGGEIGGRGK
jgi:hypothetical protein